MTMPNSNRSSSIRKGLPAGWLRFASLFLLVTALSGRCLAQATGAQDIPTTPPDVIKAATEGNLATVKAWLDKGGKVDARNDKGSSLLLLASWNGHKEIVNLLLSKGADVKIRSNSQNTPLGFAAESGHADIVEILLARGADPNTVEQHGYSPLIKAAIGGNVKVVELLLAAKVDPNFCAKGTGQTALMVAAARGNLKVVEKLIDARANPEAIARCDDEGCPGHTALDWAVQNGHTEVVRYLVSKGVDVDALPHTKDVAVKEGRIEISELLDEAKPSAAVNNSQEKLNRDLVKMVQDEKGTDGYEKVQALLTRGANPNAFTNTLQNPLCFALKDRRPDIAKLLLKNGANPRIFIQETIYKGTFLEPVRLIDHTWTPLLFAAQNAPADVVKLLIDGGCDVNHASEYGYTSLEMAAERDDGVEVVKLLLEKGARPDQPGRQGITPLIAAASRKDGAEVIKLLFEKGAKASQSGKDPDAPLCLAVQQNSLESVRLLLAKGADVNGKDARGYPPLAYAENEYYVELIDMLKKAGATPVDRASLKLRNPLLKAVAAQDLERVKLLIGKGVPLNDCDEGGTTLLLCALGSCEYKPNDAIARLLIESGADPNLAHGHFPVLLPLTTAIAHNKRELVSLLLQKGAKPNAASGDGVTPLMVAAEYNSVEIVDILIQAKADINAKDKNQKTALSRALEKGKNDIAAALRKAGAKE
jgi:ankyrin repeat protein